MVTNDVDTGQGALHWITDVTHPTGSRDVTCATGSLETMRTILAWGLVDLAMPSQSLLLLKPLSLARGGVLHGGGAKFDGPEDPTYQGFLAWISRYSACAAQDPTLPKAAPAPPAVPPELEDAGIAPSDGTSSIYDFCNCMLFNCHDASHAKWGEADAQRLAGCRAEAINLPVFGAPTMSGHFLECRAAFCAQGRNNPDACSAALGDTVCR